MSMSKLESLLEHAINSVPYYKGMDQNFSDFPIVNKEVIRNNQIDFLSVKYAPDQLYKEFTSGTTGEPLICYKSERDRILLSKSLYRHRMKYCPTIGCFEKMLRFFPGFKDNWKIDQNNLYLSYLYFDDQNIMKEYVSRIITFSPSVIFATPSSLVTFLKMLDKFYLTELFLGKTHFKYIELTGEVVTTDIIEYLKALFNCKVVSHYGCRELWHIGFMSDTNEYALCDDNVYVEILDDRGATIEPGGVGNIVITSLNVYSMPIIRYSIGDRGSMMLRKSPSGRIEKTLRLESGRLHEDIVIAGKTVGSVFFHQLFRVVYSRGYSGILKYQIKSVNSTLIILLTVSLEYSIAAEELIKSLIISRFGGITVDIQYHDNINLDQGGKSKLFL